MDANLLNLFDCEVQCEYKGRKYSARDNGAIMRHPKEGHKPNANDNIWTFGTKNDSTGYMMFTSAIRVHQVVCTAFHGPAPDGDMVVDHKDTNRCNNRPENLRWVTRLENALNNPITRQKIILCCGSIENFLKNPSMLRENSNEPNFTWMRTVTKAEASKCMVNLTRWAAQDKVMTPKGEGMGDWIFGEQNPNYQALPRPNAPAPTSKEMSQADYNRKIMEEMSSGYFGEDKKPTLRTPEEIKKEENPEPDIMELADDSLTPGAKQLWITPTEFPLCPTENQERTLAEYLKNLVPGKVFSKNKNGEFKVVQAEYNPDKDAIFLITEVDGFKPWALCDITMHEGFFIHDCFSSFFKEDGALKYFTIAMGREWTGGEVFDDGCM